MAHTYSPASIALMARGVFSSHVAKALGTGPPAVTRWLRGENPAPEALYDEIAAQGGRDLAEHVRRLVEDARAEQLQAKLRAEAARADERQARRHAAAAQADQRQSAAS